MAPHDLVLLIGLAACGLAEVLIYLNAPGSVVDRQRRREARSKKKAPQVG